MISTPSSPTFTTSRSVADKLRTENDNPQLSPKRSFALLEEDHLSQPELKRRDMHPSRRAPLDPSSASNLENRRRRDSLLTDSASYHTHLVTPSSVPDPRTLHPDQPVGSGSCRMQRSDTPAALVCSWPPPAPSSGSRSSYRSSVGQLSSQVHRLDEKLLSRATFPESTSTAWSPPDSFQTLPTPTMTKSMRTTGWKTDSMLQPIRSRTHFMPSVRRPPGELWRSDSGPTEADHDPVDAADSRVCPTPPGLPPPRPELGRSGPNSDLLPRGSVSLSLAHGSQPLRASEQTKAVPPIGAERSRVVSNTSSKSSTRNFPAASSRDPSDPLWQSSPLSPSPRAKHGNRIHSSNTMQLPEQAQATSGDAMSREGLRRLLRHAVRNQYAPKIISPLSPLRTATAALDLSTDPAYQARIPSQLNIPSPRYTHCLLRRARTVCEGYQSLDWNATCAHCQECKRDTIGKRLLALRYRQQQTYHFQRNKPLVYPSRGSTNDDRIVLANRIREVFAYEMDEEEKRLWEEVAAATGAAPVSFARVGAHCAAAAHGGDDGIHDDYLEMPDVGFLANESATLFREVSVY